jgi:hypothetical protein
LQQKMAQLWCRLPSPHAPLFFIKIAEDDDLAIIGWPMDVTVEVVEKPFGLPHQTAKKDPPPEPSWRIPLASTLMSSGNVMKSPAGTSVVAVIQTAPVLESWHRLAMGSPLWRESEHIWCLSCPPLLASREQERRTLKASEKEKRIVRSLTAQDE